MRVGTSFPKKDNIVNFEELYCGYLTDEEIAGFPSGTGQLGSGGNKRPRASSKQRGYSKSSPGATLLPSEELHNLLGDVSMDEDYEDGYGIPPPGQRRRDAGAGMTQHFSTVHGSWQPSKVPLDMTAPSCLRKSASAPDFKKTNVSNVKERSDANAK